MSGGDSTTGSVPQREEFDGVLRLLSEEAERYLADLDASPVLPKGLAEAVASAAAMGALPEQGVGASAALRELVELRDGFLASSGPRFFGWVTGGVTPAALGGDWLASLVDQNNADWAGAPLAQELEAVSIRWLLDLFGLPTDWSGVLTTGATMANFVALAAARRWWGLRQGVDVDADGLAGLPRPRVLASGYVHPSDTKVLAMLGMGRGTVERLTRDAVGRIDLAALERELRAATASGAPTIVIASAGEVNAGDFDPIEAMADLAKEHGAWLHVDGAFGLFAAVSPRTKHLVEGIAKADSVIADGHKWLNVPYDSGFAFVRDRTLLPPAFAIAAAYLPSLDDVRPGFAFLGPESSRRARSLAVWATLRAYGREGYRSVVEGHLDLAQRLAQRVREAADLELLADVGFDIVCFRYRPSGMSDGPELDDLNRRLGAAVIEDGRVFFGTTSYGGRVAFRPAIVNWRTRDEDIDLVADVTLEIGARIAAGG
jgi:glutamate/tyrosine decarboxylase-like PLP-dependent enzyme